jgi:hypothetical protein
MKDDLVKPSEIGEWQLAGTLFAYTKRVFNDTTFQEELKEARAEDDEAEGLKEAAAAGYPAPSSPLALVHDYKIYPYKLLPADQLVQFIWSQESDEAYSFRGGHTNLECAFLEDDLQNWGEKLAEGGQLDKDNKYYQSLLVNENLVTGQVDPHKFLSHSHAQTVPDRHIPVSRSDAQASNLRRAWHTLEAFTAREISGFLDEI